MCLVVLCVVLAQKENLLLLTELHVWSVVQVTTSRRWEEGRAYIANLVQHAVILDVKPATIVLSVRRVEMERCFVRTAVLVSTVTPPTSHVCHVLPGGTRTTQDGRTVWSVPRAPTASTPGNLLNHAHQTPTVQLVVCHLSTALRYWLLTPTKIRVFLCLPSTLYWFCLLLCF